MLQTDAAARDLREPAAERSRSTPAPRLRRVIAAAWAPTWPRFAALALAVFAWQAVVWSGWRPSYVLPGPGPVAQRLLHDLANGALLPAVAITMQRALIGFAVATVIGTLLGLALVRTRVLRAAAGSLITGLQSMPSVAWFPLAILLFKLTEGAILFVVVLGAAPSVANGLISGVDHVPPQLLRAGRVLGADGLRLYRHVLLPAALPGFVAGLKQGWAFAWRSLMAGELLVVIGGHQSLGVRLQYAREFSDSEGLLAAMVVVLLIGVLIDGAAFGYVERTVRRHRGLLEARG